MKIIFLLSLPRSGSTLIQRILGSHPDIATRTEPWLLLPLLYTTKETGVFAEYEHRHSNRAINDFLQSIDKGPANYDRCIRDFAYSLYQNACTDSEKYFLDKTPRYTIVADRLLEVFDDDKFIIIWRNPLSVISSMIKTWSKDRFFLVRSITDLYKGFDTIYTAYINNKERFLTINYEDFLDDSEKHLKIISDYLEIPYDPSILERFHKTRLDGYYGDKKGYLKYDYVNKQVADKWKETIDNPFRKLWCRKYLKWIGRERLEEIGYSYDGLLEEIASNPNRRPARAFVDIFCYFGAEIVSFFEPFILKYKFSKRNSRKSRKTFLA